MKERCPPEDNKSSEFFFKTICDDFTEQYSVM